MSTTLPSWVQNFFDGFYAQCDLRWPAEHQKYVAQGLLNHLRLSPGARVFDQCCGEGYLAHALAAEGCRVWGIDQSSRYIHTAQHLTPSGTFVAGDAGTYAPDVELDGAVNWHTSLGYGGQMGALALLRQLTTSLKKQGLFVVDVRNVELYKQSPLVSIEHIDTAKWGTVQMTRVGRWEGNTLWQNWNATVDGEEVWSQNDAACFHPSLPEMDDLFDNIGARRVTVLGTLDAPFDRGNHERMIVVGQKI